MPAILSISFIAGSGITAGRSAASGVAEPALSAEVTEQPVVAEEFASFDRGASAVSLLVNIAMSLP